MNNKEAIEILTSIKNTPQITWENGADMAFKLAIRALEDRPQWIEHYDSSDGFTWFTCSRCMFKAYEEDYRYCPNCGARMEAENEDSN